MTVVIDKTQSRFPANIVRNQKYNFATFLPLVFYEQFKFFFNLYFLLVALSQFVPALKIGMHAVSLNNLLALTYTCTCRFYYHICCSFGLRPHRHHGEGGL